MTLDTNFIYPKLIRMFFANAIVDEDIPAIISFIKRKMTFLSEQYISDWLNLSLSRPSVFSSNKLVICAKPNQGSSTCISIQK